MHNAQCVIINEPKEAGAAECAAFLFFLNITLNR